MGIGKDYSLQSRILFTILVLLVFRLGSHVPISGVNPAALGELILRNQSGILGMLNVLSGGALGRMSIFALAVMPYITSSIVVQLLSVAYKPLERLKKEGELGRKKINQISRFLTILFAAFQAYGVALSLEGVSTSVGSVVVINSLFFKISTIITLVTGTVFLMWLGEQITSYGVGNGVSLIIFVSIISGLPSTIISVLELSRKSNGSVFSSLILLGSTLFLICMIVFFEKAYRKIVIHHPKKQFNHKLANNQNNYMPFKLNTAGVIPPMFASSLLLFPLTIANFSSKNYSVVEWFSYHFGRGKPLFILLYMVLIIFFSFFYTGVVFNSEETADNLKKHGAFIPGKRPGKNTAEYFDFVLTRLTVLGALYLCFVCIVTEMFLLKISVAFTLSGASLLIMVNVVIDTISQLQSYMFSRRYDNLMKKVSLR